MNAVPYSIIIWGALVVDTRGVSVAFSQITSQTALTLSSLAAALAGIYLLTTIPDVAGDRSAGKRTIAVVYGSNKALVGAILSLALAFVFGIVAHHPGLYLTAAVALALALFALKTGRLSHILLAAKAPILLLSAFEVYRHPFYGVFLLALIALTRVYYKRRFGIVYPQMA